MPILISDTLVTALKAKAKAEGFNDIGITSARLAPEIGQRLQEFVDDDRHGSMAWMKETLARRKSPELMWPEARTAIMLAMSYGPDVDPMLRLQNKSEGVISVYALHRDYHDVIKGKLKHLAQWFAQTVGADVKVFVDTAPLLEKPLAAQAGLGWQGKHTNLVSRELGSWFFLGAILTTAQLQSDEGEVDHCGSCRACLDICPTQAFIAPYQLDAKLCISYLTIEHKEAIPVRLRKAMGNRIYGCDDCLAVCPWNKFAGAAHEAKLVARAELISPQLADLLQLDDAAFRTLFSGSPVKRIGRDRFVRNCLIAAGNSGDLSLVPFVDRLIVDQASVVRGAAVWALQQLQGAASLHDVKQRHLAIEHDETVRAEWLA
jgi:epoxyqueuosine reductase